MPDRDAAERLHQAIAAVCPITGVDPRDWSDRSAWIINFDPNATPKQHAAAADVIAKFDPDAPPPKWINAERDRRIATFVFNKTLFQLRMPDDQINISGAATIAMLAISAGAKPGDLRWANPQADFVWIAADNSMVPMDAQTVIAFAQAAAAWKTRHILTGRAMKDTAPAPADYKDDKYWPQPGT